jgi:hypothetical protein
MEAWLESIPKQETNATRYYLARYVFTFAKLNASQEVETVGTAHAWLILVGRTKQSLQVVHLTSVLCLAFASASGGDRQDPSKNPIRRRPLPTE